MQHCVHGLIKIHVIGVYHKSHFAAWCYHVTEEGEDLIVIFAARAAVSSRITHGCKYTIQTGTYTEAFLQSKSVNEKHYDFCASLLDRQVRGQELFAGIANAKVIGIDSVAAVPGCASCRNEEDF